LDILALLNLNVDFSTFTINNRRVIFNDMSMESFMKEMVGQQEALVVPPIFPEPSHEVVLVDTIT
jgi:hypothetical protein